MASTGKVAVAPPPPASPSTAPPPVKDLVFRSLKRTHDMFLANVGQRPHVDDRSIRVKIAAKVSAEYSDVKDMPLPTSTTKTSTTTATVDTDTTTAVGKVIDDLNKPSIQKKKPSSSTSNVELKTLALRAKTVAGGREQAPSSALALTPGQTKANILALRAPSVPKPKWQAPWELYRVVSGHTGWVRCIGTDPSNKLIATGSADRTVKLWDIASGTLKLSLTGHVSSVRAVVFSDRHPYMFTAGEDKQIKCWDLECNKVVRHYHGHLSAVWTLALHGQLDVLASGGRDSSVRIWDMRTRANIFCLTGHNQTVSSVDCQSVDPQVVSSSMDSTVRLWDLVAGKCMTTLTNHKKSVRALKIHNVDFGMVSASADNIKKWKFPNGDFIHNLEPTNTITNSLAVRSDMVAAGCDNGDLCLYDWVTGHMYQRIKTKVQPGSLESENGILGITFDRSGQRIVTAETDKTLKFYRPMRDATEETHPLNWTPAKRKGGASF